jgi:UDP-glucose:(heptosyl)LPS alpha-1,3-glucosyltransferase
MKIALSFPGCHRRGGVERVMLECANYLVGRDHEVHALACDWDAASLAQSVIKHPVEARRWPAVLALSAYLNASRGILNALRPAPDVVASFGVAAPPGSVVWMQSVHAAWIEISQQTRGFSGRLKQCLNPFHGVVLRMEREFLRGRQYRKVIALTPQVKADVERHYSVPPEDIVVLPNGYSASEFSLERSRKIRSAMRQKLGYAADHRVIVFVANEIERKGLVPLLRGIAQLQDSSLRLLAVGRLDQNAVASEIQRLGLQGRVHFTGPTSDTADYYAASDLFALPTKYEAWGLVIVEAMACGLPVLTSRLAGASVAVEEGRTGWLLENPADPDEITEKLDRLLNDASADAAAIVQSVQRFEWNRVLADYEKILAGAANTKS